MKLIIFTGQYLYSTAFAVFTHNRSRGIDVTTLIHAYMMCLSQLLPNQSKALGVVNICVYVGLPEEGACPSPWRSYLREEMGGLGTV